MSLEDGKYEVRWKICEDLKLSGFGILPSTYNLYTSDFFFCTGDLRSGQFRDLPIISQWGKNQMAQILIRYVQIDQNHVQLGYF